MKLINPILFLVACAIALVLAPTAYAFWLIMFVLGGLLAASGLQARLCVTLTPTEILTLVLKAFRTKLPALNFFSHDFSSATAKYGQQVIAHLPTVPSVVDHVAATGYNANAQNMRDLLTDVPITMNKWKDVQFKVLHADASQDASENYLKTIANAGYALAKAVVDEALATAIAANFSRKTTASIATTTKSTLSIIREAMSDVNALTPRFGLVNSAAASALDEDPRIASGDYYNQRSGADPFLTFNNLAGFQQIQEYADFPSNGQNLSGFFFDQRAIGIASRLPDDPDRVAAALGIPVTYSKDIVQDPETGLALIAFGYTDPNTHYVYLTISVMFGVVGGSQAGAEGAILDYAGHRLVTS